MNSAPPAPLFVYLELTKDCNLRCRFCDIWKVKYRNPQYLSGELSLGEIVNLVDELKRMGTILIHLFGGEALLRPDIIEIVREINKRGLAVSLTTNGTLLSEGMVKNLIDAGLKHIAISLDSSFAEIHDKMRGVSGTFEKVIQSIANIKRISDKMKITIHALITKNNFKYLLDMVKLSIELKSDAIKFIPVQKTYPQNLYLSQDENIFFNTSDEINSLENELNRTIDFLSRTRMDTFAYEFLRKTPDFYRNKKTDFRCLAGYILCELDSAGNVYPCASLAEAAGNIREGKFSEIWNSEKFNLQRKEIINCHNCWMSCYIEPSLRFSLKYQIKNLPKTIKEYMRFLC